MCTSDTGFRSCVIYSGDKLFIARYVKIRCAPSVDLEQNLHLAHFG